MDGSENDFNVRELRNQFFIKLKMYLFSMNVHAFHVIYFLLLLQIIQNQHLRLRDDALVI